jgi:hypothetical protein
MFVHKRNVAQFVCVICCFNLFMGTDGCDGSHGLGAENSPAPLESFENVSTPRRKRGSP